MAVLHLVKTNNTETIEALLYLVEQARIGNVVGIAVCFRDRSGNEEAAFTGAYKAHPDKAISAAMRLSWRLTQLQEGSSA
jgi:hypothetical protein